MAGEKPKRFKIRHVGGILPAPYRHQGAESKGNSARKNGMRKSSCQMIPTLAVFRAFKRLKGVVNSRFGMMLAWIMTYPYSMSLETGKFTG